MGLRQTRHQHPPLGDLRHFRRWREALEGKTSFRACRSFIAPMSKRQLRAVHSVMTSRRGRSGDFTYRPHADADGGAHPCRHARAWKNAGGHVRSDACRPRSRRAQRRRACPARSRARVADVGRFRRVSRGLGDFAIAKRSTMRKVRVAARRDGVRGGLSPAAIHETGRPNLSPKRSDAQGGSRPPHGLCSTRPIAGRLRFQPSRPAPSLPHQAPDERAENTGTRRASRP